MEHHYGRAPKFPAARVVESVPGSDGRETIFCHNGNIGHGLVCSCAAWRACPPPRAHAILQALVVALGSPGLDVVEVVDEGGPWNLLGTHVLIIPPRSPAFARLSHLLLQQGKRASRI
jgi:hypothetical protein